MARPRATDTEEALSSFGGRESEPDSFNRLDVCSVALDRGQQEWPRGYSPGQSREPVGVGLSRREEPAGLPGSPREGTHEEERDFYLGGGDKELNLG